MGKIEGSQIDYLIDEVQSNWKTHFSNKVGKQNNDEFLRYIDYIKDCCSNGNIQGFSYHVNKQMEKVRQLKEKVQPLDVKPFSGSEIFSAGGFHRFEKLAEYVMPITISDARMPIVSNADTYNGLLKLQACLKDLKDEGTKMMQFLYN